MQGSSHPREWKTMGLSRRRVLRLKPVQRLSLSFAPCIGTNVSVKPAAESPAFQGSFAEESEAPTFPRLPNPTMPAEPSKIGVLIRAPPKTRPSLPRRPFPFGVTITPPPAMRPSPPPASNRAPVCSPLLESTSVIAPANTCPAPTLSSRPA